MSQLPLYTSHGETPIPAETILLMEHLNRPPLSALQVREQTRQDPVLAQMLRLVQDGWLEQGHEKELQPFASWSNGLSVQDGCLLWGNRVIMPPPGRQQILDELHWGHPGMTKMKSLARMRTNMDEQVANMDEQIEQTVWHCSACQQNHASPLKAPLHPWSRLYIDFAGPMEDHMLLVIIDAHSKWIEAIGVRLATSAVVMQCLRSVFARFGVPDMVVSDNGTCFVSSEFEHFLERNSIRLTTPAPYHPASNSLDERAVQIVKKSL